MFCLTKSDWAIWVQAIGAIVAIGAAIAISRSEGIRSRKEQRLKWLLQNVRLGTLVGDAINATELVSLDLRFDRTSQIKDLLSSGANDTQRLGLN